NMQIGVVSADLKLLSTAKRKTKPEDGLDAVLDRMVSGIEEACAGARMALTDAGGIGIGAPGAVEPDKGIVLEAVNLRWTDVALTRILRDRLGVPVFLDNDVHAALYGENRLGAGRG